MSIRYNNASGQETILSGLTPGGDIEAGAVATRSGKIDVSPLEVGAYQVVNVAFDTPMPDDTYIINIDCTSGRLNIATFNKTANGFSIIYLNSSNLTQPQGDSIDWTATKTYTVQHAAQNAEDIANIKAVIPSTASSTNQLTPKKYVDDADTALDGRVSDLEDLIPNNASVTNQLATKAEINNVYTKTEVDTKLDNKQNTLTFDNEPTAGSSNPVKSSGVKNTIDDTAADIYEAMGKNGAKNLFKNKATSNSQHNITFTVNSDGSIRANTGSNTAQYNWNYRLNKFTLKAGTYILSDGNTGDFSNCYLQVTNESESTSLATCRTDHNKQFTLDTDQVIVVRLFYTQGASFDYTYYPMIRLASDTDSTYQPYAMTNKELTKIYKNVSFTGTTVVLDDITTLVNLFVNEDDSTYYGNFIRVGKNAGYYTLSKYTDSVNSFIVGIVVTGTLGYLIHWVNGNLSINELLKRTAVTKTSVAPFRIYNNGRTANVSTIDGSSISDVTLQATTWATQVRNLGVIDSTMGTDYVMAPVLYQVANDWHTGVARIFYTGRVDLWSPIAITGSFIPYLNVTLTIT